MNGIISNIFNVDFILALPALLLCITVHEVSHGYAAYLLGDPTAKNAGRLTLNPLKHIDPMGLLMLWIFRFGWAKPVPVHPGYFKNRRKGMLLVSIAGPLSNCIFAILTGIVYFNVYRYANHIVLGFLQMLLIYNATLFAFNLIPVPPLDGSKVVASILPGKYWRYTAFMEQYGTFILLALVIFDLTGIFIMPIANALLDLVFTIASHLTFF